MGNFLAPCEQTQRLFRSLQKIRVHRAIPKHEACVRNRSDLIDEQIRIVFELIGFLDTNTQRK